MNMLNQSQFNNAIQLPVATYASAPHVSRTERFVHIPTHEIVERMEQAGFVPVRASARNVRNPDKQGFQKHVIRFRRHDQVDLRVLNENVPEIALMNAHDGTSPAVLWPAVFRLICLNGMVVCDSDLGKISISHRGNDVADKIIEGSYTVIERADAAIDAIGSWSQINLSHEKMMEFADRALDLKYVTREGEKRNEICPIEPIHILRPRRYADTGTDLWRVFNRVQENLIKGGQAGYIKTPNEGDKFRSTRAVRSAEKDITLNAALWGLAKEYAVAA
jgi:hypothetical protein